MKQIAARCGVHVMTVSRALRDHPRISAETTRRVKVMAARLGYDPLGNADARRLVARRLGQVVPNQVIGLFLPRGFHRVRHFNEIHAGVMDTLAEKRQSLLVSYVEDPQPREGQPPLPPAFARGDIDATIILARPGPVQSILQSIQPVARHPIPAVSLIWKTPGCACVRFDDREAGRLAAQHLLGLGHRQILFLGLPDTGEVQAERVAGFRKALKQAGLPPRQHFSVIDAWLGSFAPLSDRTLGPIGDVAKHPLALHLAAHPEITALAALNDTLALQAWQLLDCMGQRVPEDLSLIGCGDDENRFDTSGVPQLSTVRLPLADLGSRGAELAVRLGAGVAVGEECLTLPVEIVARHSTGRTRT
jgi:DNA-binding LacI/PurR family transcriptional regulator